MFVDKMTTIATQRLQDQPLKPVKQVDMEIPLDYLKENVLEQIEEMGPFGMDNPEPLFLIRNLKVVSSRIIGNDLSHLRLKLISEDQITVDAVAFRQGWRRNDLPERIDVLGTFEKIPGRISKPFNSIWLISVPRFRIEIVKSAPINPRTDI